MRACLLTPWFRRKIAPNQNRKENALSATRNVGCRLIQIKAAPAELAHTKNMWRDISSAPRDREITLAVIDTEGLHALVMPCRRIADGWVNATTGTRLDVRPTHWREWGAAD